MAPVMAQRIWLLFMRTRSLIPGLCQWVKHPVLPCGVGCRCGSDLALLWLWRRPVATAPIRPLGWEPLYAKGAALKRQKKKKDDQEIMKTMGKSETNTQRNLQATDKLLVTEICAESPELHSLVPVGAWEVRLVAPTKHNFQPPETSSQKTNPSTGFMLFFHQVPVALQFWMQNFNTVS